MDTVEESAFDESRGDGFKQMTVLQHIRHRVFGVAHKYHRSGSLMRAFAAVERLVGKIVLHGVYQYGIHVAAFLLLELVPGYYIPISYQSKYFLVTTHLDEESGTRHITAAHQHAVWSLVLEHVAFSGSFRAEFHEIEIVFYMRQQSGQCNEFLSSVELVRV